MLSRCRRSVGEVPERSIGAVSKTVVPLAGDRGFESLPLRQPTVSARLRLSLNPSEGRSLRAYCVSPRLPPYGTISPRMGEQSGERGQTSPISSRAVEKDDGA